MILLHLKVTFDPQDFAFISHPSGARCIARPFSTRTTQQNWRICAMFAGVRRSVWLDGINRNRGTSAVLPGEILALPCAYHRAPTYVITMPACRPRRCAEGDAAQNEPGRIEAGVYQQPLIPCLRVGTSQGIKRHAASDEQRALDGVPDATHEEQATRGP